MHIFTAFWGLGLLMLLTGCSILPRSPSPPIALHDFGSGGQAVDSPAAWSTVTVEAPEWLKDEHIRYRLMHDDPTRIRFYSRDRWLAAPPSLLAHRLSLASGGGRYRLKIALLELEQVFAQSQNTRVVLSFRATADLPEPGTIAVERVFRFDRTTPSADAAGAVSAFAGVIEEATRALTAWSAELPEYTGSSQPEKK